MPNPKKYKNKKKWMKDCLHQTLHVEKRDKEQSLAQCFNMWRHKRSLAEILRGIAASIRGQSNDR